MGRNSKILIAVPIVLFGILAAALAPEVRRYLRISRM
jgi:hypothetical protein